MPSFVPLNSNKHREFRFTPAKDFKFAQKISEIDLTLREIWALSSFFPIVFVHKQKKSQELLVPTAVIRKTDSTNNLICRDGSINFRTVPSLLVAYPFLIEVSGVDKIQILIDETSDCFSKTGRLRLFCEDGAYTNEIKNIIELLRIVANGLREAQELGSIASRLGLLKPAGDRFSNSGYFYMDLTSLVNLSDSTALMLHDRNWLHLFYAIAISILNDFNITGALDLPNDIQPRALLK